MSVRLDPRVCLARRSTRVAASQDRPVNCATSKVRSAFLNKIKLFFAIFKVNILSLCCQKVSRCCTRDRSREYKSKLRLRLQCKQEFLLLLFKVFSGHMSFLGTTCTPGFDFWDVSSRFQRQSGFCLICFFAEMNVMYIPGDPPLVLHVPTSWRPEIFVKLPSLRSLVLCRSLQRTMCLLEILQTLASQTTLELVQMFLGEVIFFHKKNSSCLQSRAVLCFFSSKPVKCYLCRFTVNIYMTRLWLRCVLFIRRLLQ